MKLTSAMRSKRLIPVFVGSIFATSGRMRFFWYMQTDEFETDDEKSCEIVVLARISGANDTTIIEINEWDVEHDSEHGGKLF